MKAVQVARFGGAEELTLADVPRPDAGPGEARIKLELSGVNFIDIYMRDGSYSRSRTYVTPLPMTLGMEGCGMVDAVGANVDGIKPGDRVAYCISRGSYAEYTVVPAWRLVPVPSTVPAEIATALMLQGSTAHYLTHSAFRLEPGMICLVHAGAGGVGQLLVQLAKRRGARVIATVGSPAKAEIARSRGADHCILYRETDFREEVMRFTGGKGVNVVYDSVGRDTLPKSLRSLGRRGTCINFGASSGQADPVSVLDLAEAGSVYLTRPHLSDYMTSADEIRGRASDLFAARESGALVVAIDREFPLSAVAEAHRILESRGTKGKLLLRVA